MHYTKDQKIETHLLFLDVLPLVRYFFELKNSRVRPFYLARTHKRSLEAFFLHTPDFSLSRVRALKVAWGKDTSSCSKEPGSDLPLSFLAWAPFCKCGWRHHISRSSCGPDCYSFKIFRHFWLAAIPRLIFHNRRSTSLQGRELKKKMAFAALRIWIWIWIFKEGKNCKDHKKTHHSKDVIYFLRRNFTRENMWRIMQITGDVQPRWITASSICIILHILLSLIR